MSIANVVSRVPRYNDVARKTRGPTTPPYRTQLTEPHPQIASTESRNRGKIIGEKRRGGKKGRSASRAEIEIK
jgi:hypothetical protein